MPRRGVAVGSNNVTKARDFIDAFNAHDWDRASAEILPDAVYDEHGTGRKVKGKDEIIDTLQGWVEAMPDAKGTVKNIIDGGTTVVLEVVWKGTMTGQLGELSATGKSQITPATVIFDFDGGQITECRQYFDSLSLFQQLGLMPELARA
jgi:steroid delta-isomerase-like uncharacterized protein